MTDVLISYARADTRLAARLAAGLEQLGLTVWWDIELPPGADFERMIGERITGATVVIVLWTPSSVASNWVRDEAGLALQHNKLIPIRVGADPPLGFRSLHTLNMDNWQGEPLDAEALADIARACGR